MNQQPRFFVCDSAHLSHAMLKEAHMTAEERAQNQGRRQTPVQLQLLNEPARFVRQTRLLDKIHRRAFARARARAADSRVSRTAAESRIRESRGER